MEKTTRKMALQERRRLYNRYKHDALFRHWLLPLGKLARAGQGYEVEIWHEAECALRRLKDETETDLRDATVQQIYSDLCEEHDSRPVYCIAVMTVLLTMLGDAAPTIDNPEANPHSPICVAICAMLGEDQRFLTLLDAFFERSRDYRHGEQVVLPVVDYLAEVEPEQEEATVEEDSSESEFYKMWEQMVCNALKWDDVNELKALKTRLYDLKNPSITGEWIERINARIEQLMQAQGTPRVVENNGTCILNNQGPVNGDVREQNLFIPSSNGNNLRMIE